MKRTLQLFCLILCMGVSASAQYPLVTIKDIQTKTPGELAACNDTANFYEDTVRIQGVVITNVDSSRFDEGADQGCFSIRTQFWIMDTAGGTFSGLDVLQFFDPADNDVATLFPGDFVEITGVIEEFGHESEIVPLEGVDVIPLGTGTVPGPVVVNVSDLNDGAQVNKLETGEQYEGTYIEVQNVTVVSVDPFSSSTRVSFVVENSAGDRVNVSDKFFAQCLPAGCPSGDFVMPSVGDNYNYIRGILTHSNNGCTGGGGRGYEMHPTQASDYDINSSAPSIGAIQRNKVCLTPADSICITATVSDPDGMITAVELNYATGVCPALGAYLSIPMVESPVGSNNYRACIPPQADGTSVNYYVSATDDSTNTSNNPNVPGGSFAHFLTVRDGGCTLFDVQFVPSCFADDGDSPYQNMDVTVEGVVTASAEMDNLGFVFIQEEGRLDFAGTMLTGSVSLTTLKVGDKVEVTGTVRENFGMTRIEDVTSVSITGTGTITPIALDPGNFTTYGFSTNEPYEGMLVALTGADMTCVDANADITPPDSTPNFAEWRVGLDEFDPDNGCRILSGRTTGSAFGSLNVSYVNSDIWATLDGTMNVDVCVVEEGWEADTIVGIMFYSFGNMKLLPRNNADFFGTFACPDTTIESITEGLLDGEINAYPNPTNDQLVVDFSFGTPVGSATAALYDLVGRKVAETSIEGLEGKAAIDVNGIAPGTYLLRVTDQDGTWSYTDKIIVTR